MWGRNTKYNKRGQAIMGYYSMNNGWHKYGNENLNLTDEQKSQWNKIATNGEGNLKTANDSINYYVRQVHRLQQERSNQVNTDLEQIKKVLTPAQYTQFLEKLVTGNPNN